MAKQIPQGIQPPTATLKADFLQFAKQVRAVFMVY